MTEHEPKNLSCGGCRRGYPVRCKCGGLIHADEGVSSIPECDGCDEPERAVSGHPWGVL